MKYGIAVDVGERQIGSRPICTNLICNKNKEGI